MSKKEIVPIASMVECNHGGIEIGNLTSDSLFWRRNWGADSITPWKPAEIEYSDVDNDGEPLFNIYDERESQPYFRLDDGGYMYFLNNFLRHDR